jgi:multicomponent Na+:H+ antiporter subunit E
MDEEDPTWPFVGVLLAVLWLFVNGVALEPAALLGQTLVGLAFGLPVAYASRRFYWPETDPWRLLRTAPYMAIYVTVFVKDLILANVDVAYRVLSPSMPIEPAVIDLPLRVETDVAITTIANSITLTPGTLTLDYDADRNALYVHAIDGRDPAAVARPIRRWEDYALAIFDEELEPGDPVPGEATLAEDGGVDGSGVGGDGVEPRGGDPDGR